MSLKGKIALVTGASRGIGKEIAKTLAADGAFVVVNYNGSKEAADQVVAEIAKEGGTAESYGCNVSDFSAVEVMIKEIIEKHAASKGESVNSFVRRAITLAMEQDQQEQEA